MASEFVCCPDWRQLDNHATMLPFAFHLWKHIEYHQHLIKISFWKHLICFHVLICFKKITMIVPIMLSNQGEFTPLWFRSFSLWQSESSFTTKSCKVLRRGLPGIFLRTCCWWISGWRRAHHKLKFLQNTNWRRCVIKVERLEKLTELVRKSA